jgi:hypothetical protein
VVFNAQVCAIESDIPEVISGVHAFIYERLLALFTVQVAIIYDDGYIVEARIEHHVILMVAMGQAIQMVWPGDAKKRICRDVDTNIGEQQ